MSYKIESRTAFAHEVCQVLHVTSRYTRYLIELMTELSYITFSNKIHKLPSVTFNIIRSRFLYIINDTPVRK